MIYVPEYARREIVTKVCEKTRTFGCGRTSQYNPIANTLKDREPLFAAGVDVREVVDLVIGHLQEMEI